jgi:hypothetical protein
MTASFYRRLIVNFSTITNGLTKLTSGDHRAFKWNDEAQKSYEDTKDAMCAATVSYSADHTRPFYCSSDASAVGSSFVLWQYDDNNRTRFIAAHSRTFNKTTSNYSTFKKEILAVTTGLANFDYLLRFAVKIHLFVDARSILYLRMCKNSSPMLVRFSLPLSNYPIEIQHINTKLNCLADVFSRCIPKNPAMDVNFTAKPMSELEALRILNELTIPSDTILTVEQVQALLTSEALPSLCDLTKRPIKKAKYNTAQPISSKNLFPVTKKDKKVNMPRTSSWHPFYWNQKQQIYDQHKPDYLAEPITLFSKQFTENTNNTHSSNFPNDDSLLSNVPWHKHTDTNNHTDDSNVTKDYPVFAGKSLVCLHNNDLRSESLELNLGIITDGKISIESFREAQSLDEDIASMLRKPLRGYHINKGILIKKVNTVDKLVLPDNLLQSLLFSLHFSIYGLHNSRKKIMEIINQLYYVPNLAKKVNDYTANCYFCMTIVLPNTPRHTIGRIPKPIAPRVSYSFDILPGLPNSNGFTMIYIFVDDFSLYSILVPAKSKSAPELLQAFKTHVIKPFLPPQSIHSDGERATICMNGRIILIC